VSDWARVQKLLKDYLDDYNSSHTNTIDLVFFQTAVDHVCHLCRVLQQVRISFSTLPCLAMLGVLTAAATVQKRDRLQQHANLSHRPPVSEN
jgi:hypothetical protein